MRLTKLAHILPPLLLVSSLFAIYLRTMAPGLTWANDGRDGGDLITALAIRPGPRINSQRSRPLGGRRGRSLGEPGEIQLLHRLQSLWGILFGHEKTFGA